MSFSEDSDANWDFRDSYKDALKSMIYTELDNGIYYYISFGRLLGKRDHQIRRHEILYEFSIFSISDIKFHPIYQTNKI